MIRLSKSPTIQICRMFSVPLLDLFSSVHPIVEKFEITEAHNKEHHRKEAQLIVKLVQVSLFQGAKVE